MGTCAQCHAKDNNAATRRGNSGHGKRPKEMTSDVNPGQRGVPDIFGPRRQAEKTTADEKELYTYPTLATDVLNISVVGR